MAGTIGRRGPLFKPRLLAPACLPVSGRRGYTAPSALL